jgi:hypothetical protein
VSSVESPTAAPDTRTEHSTRYTEHSTPRCPRVIVSPDSPDRASARTLIILIRSGTQEIRKGAGRAATQGRPYTAHAAPYAQRPTPNASRCRLPSHDERASELAGSPVVADEVRQIVFAQAKTRSTVYCPRSSACSSALPAPPSALRRGGLVRRAPARPSRAARPPGVLALVVVLVLDTCPSSVYGLQSTVYGLLSTLHVLLIRVPRSAFRVAIGSQSGDCSHNPPEFVSSRFRLTCPPAVAYNVWVGETGGTRDDTPSGKHEARHGGRWRVFGRAGALRTSRPVRRACLEPH